MVGKRKEAKPKPIYTRIGIKVSSFDLSVESGVNIDAKDPRYAIDFDDRDPIYKYVSRVKILGAATYPAEWVGQQFEISVSGDETPSRHVFPTLKDLQERGEYGQPLSRSYRGRTLPVLRTPPGLGLLNKVRGEPTWTAWINVAARVVSDMLVVLTSNRELYVAIDERKVGRNRWIDDLALQTADPSLE